MMTKSEPIDYQAEPPEKLSFFEKVKLTLSHSIFSIIIYLVFLLVISFKVDTKIGVILSISVTTILFVLYLVDAYFDYFSIIVCHHCNSPFYNIRKMRSDGVAPGLDEPACPLCKSILTWDKESQEYARSLKNKKTMNNKGITLVELVIVIVFCVMVPTIISSIFMNNLYYTPNGVLEKIRFKIPEITRVAIDRNYFSYSEITAQDIHGNERTFLLDTNVLFDYKIHEKEIK
jgi:uncharacterized protein YbaR (Trm112 family)